MDRSTIWSLVVIAAAIGVGVYFSSLEESGKATLTYWDQVKATLDKNPVRKTNSARETARVCRTIGKELSAINISKVDSDALTIGTRLSGFANRIAAFAEKVNNNQGSILFENFIEGFTLGSIKGKMTDLMLNEAKTLQDDGARLQVAIDETSSKLSNRYGKWFGKLNLGE